MQNVRFTLPNGKEVPRHFHITEVGQIEKKFIDCGGTIRNEKVVSMQLWEGPDVWHRLEAEKLLKIIQLSEEQLALEDLEIEVEFQGDTIQKFALDLKNDQFILLAKHTACLAADNCGVSPEKIKLKLNELGNQAAQCCDPNSGCC